MRIADVMTRNVRDIAPERSIREAARLMDEMNVGVLPVCRGGRLVGLVTDRDITVRATAAGLPPDTTAVGDIMTAEPRSVDAEDDVSAALELMTDLQVRRVPVLDAAGRLVGIVALGDLAEEHAPGAGEALAGISTPSEPDRTGTPSQRAVAAAASDGDPLTPEEREELARRRLASAEQAGAEGRLDDLAAPGLAANRPDESEPEMIDRDEDLVRAAFGTAGDEPGAGGPPDDAEVDGADGGGTPFFHDDSGASSAEAAGYGAEDAQDFGIRTVAPRPRHVGNDAPGGDGSAGGLEPPAPSRQPNDR